MSYSKEPEIILNPEFKGYISPVDLLKSEGTIQRRYEANLKGTSSIFFVVKSEDYFFCFGAREDGLYIKRGRDEVFLSYEGLQVNGKVLIFAMWSVDSLALHIFDKDGKQKEEIVKTFPTAPTPKLIKWVHKRGLVPVQGFSNERDFREKVHGAISIISKKIKEADAYKSFWNFTYEGQKISSRSPKTEVEIQPLLNSLWSDQMLMSGIEVSPEVHSGAGNVDFLLHGNVNGVIEKICVEVKLAHSKDLEHGYFCQLPEYMKYHNALFGVYCVFNFKGAWFDKPDLEGERDALFYLSLKEKRHAVPEINRMRAFEIEVAKPPTASRV